MIKCYDLNKQFTQKSKVVRRKHKKHTKKWFVPKKRKKKQLPKWHQTSLSMPIKHKRKTSANANFAKLLKPKWTEHKIKYDEIRRNDFVCSFDVMLNIPFQWFWHNVFQFHFLIGCIILFSCIRAASVSARYGQRSHIVATFHINGGYFWIRSTHRFFSSLFSSLSLFHSNRSIHSVYLVIFD